MKRYAIVVVVAALALPVALAWRRRVNRGQPGRDGAGSRQDGGRRVHPTDPLRERYYIVPLRGDPALGAELLAKAGIEKAVRLDDPPQKLTARVSAANGASATQRVLSALGDEPFTIEGDVVTERDW